jgi:hypothetical protein
MDRDGFRVALSSLPHPSSSSRCQFRCVASQSGGMSRTHRGEKEEKLDGQPAAISWNHGMQPEEVQAGGCWGSTELLIVAPERSWRGIFPRKRAFGAKLWLAGEFEPSRSARLHGAKRAGVWNCFLAAFPGEDLSGPGRYRTRVLALQMPVLPGLTMVNGLSHAEF